MLPQPLWFVQILATFTFGMIFAVSQFEKLAPPEVHALAMACLADVFEYADHQAVIFAEILIAAAASHDPNDMQPERPQGIDGHLQWQERRVGELRDNIEGEGLFRVVGAESAPGVRRITRR